MSRRSILGVAVAMLTIAIGSIVTDPHAAAGGGGCHEPATDGRGSEVALEGNCMVPTVLRVAAGDAVTFTNKDEIDHTVTGAGVRSGNGTSFGSFEPISQGGTLSHNFEARGVYVYYCAYHPGMVGAIVVGEGSGTAPASANMDSASPLDVALRAASSPAPSGAAASRSGGVTIGARWFAALASGVTIVVAAAGFVLGGRRSRNLRRVKP